jgi:hypothetical protein
MTIDVTPTERPKYGHANACKKSERPIHDSMRMFIPLITRPAHSIGTPLAADCKREPMMNKAEAPIRVYFRENRSAGHPAQRAPTKQPAERAALMPPCKRASGCPK